METNDIRKLMAMAMSDKTFTVSLKQTEEWGRKSRQFSGTLELEGSFAVIREWESPA